MDEHETLPAPVAGTRRQRRKKLTDLMVAELKPNKRKRYFHPDPELPCHGVRVLPNGQKSFYVVIRDPWKKQRWIKLGNTAELKIEKARDQAREVIERIKKGKSAFEPPPVKPDSVEDVVNDWLVRHASGLRSGDEVGRVLKRHVLPVWGDRPFVEIGRSDISNLLDAVEDNHGPWVADSVLAALRSVAGWYVTRHDTYRPPFVGKMARVKREDRRRDRILTDDELRAIWQASGKAGVFGALVRLLLLTAQRRDKVATMKWSDISPDGTWTIATERGEKGNAGSLKLPQVALDIIAGQPRLTGVPYVFPAPRGKRPLNVFARHKAQLDKASGVSGYTLHDLRRTARSLMSRAKVQTEIAERVLGHARPKIEATYDVHAYDEEKADALAKLAALIERIVHPAESGKVLDFPQAAQS